MAEIEIDVLLAALAEEKERLLTPFVNGQLADDRSVVFRLGQVRGMNQAMEKLKEVASLAEPPEANETEIEDGR